MKSILQFMYLGQATFYQDRMNEFLNVARSLEVKEISKDIDQDASDSLNDQEYDKNFETNIEEKNIESSSNVEGEIEPTNSKDLSHRNVAGHFPCDSCDKHYTYKHNLNQHIRSAHEGIKFPCNNCGYEATKNSDLLRHIQSVHEDIKFLCDLCDFKATQKFRLYTHKKNK